MIREYSYSIRPEQLESSYNHLHHADALRFLERARRDLLIDIGCSLESLIEENFYMVITDVSVKYKRELTTGNITVTCENPRILSRFVLLDQRIINAQGKLAVDGTVTACFMDGNTRRLVSPPEDFVKAFLNQN